MNKKINTKKKTNVQETKTTTSVKGIQAITHRIVNEDQNEQEFKKHFLRRAENETLRMELIYDQTGKLNRISFLHLDKSGQMFQYKIFATINKDNIEDLGNGFKFLSKEVFGFKQFIGTKNNFSTEQFEYIEERLKKETDGKIQSLPIAPKLDDFISNIPSHAQTNIEKHTKNLSSDKDELNSNFTFTIN